MTTCTRPERRHAAPDVVYGPESPLAEIVRLCGRVACSDATVLLSGEAGSGKELFARWIHASSARAGGPFVVVDCSAVPEALGGVPFGGGGGAAPAGAANPVAPSVQGGTLLLDEVADLSPSSQLQLLRVLEERSHGPSSAVRLRSDVRLVVATSRGLAAEVTAGRFRRDLYYRLQVCPIEIPPLRSRRGDVPLLFEHFWRMRGETRPVQAAAMRALHEYAWPGNVRELESLAERLSVCCPSPVIAMADLPAPLRPSDRGRDAAPRPRAVRASPATPSVSAAPQLCGGGRRLGPPSPGTEEPEAREGLAAVEAPCFTEGQPVDLVALLRRLEDEYITSALRHTGGNKKAAADLLGLQRTTLVEKLRRRQRQDGSRCGEAAPSGSGAAQDPDLARADL